MKAIIFLSLLMLILFGCGQKKTVSIAPPVGITVMSPCDRDTVFVHVDKRPDLYGLYVRWPVTAHLNCNVPGGIVSLKRFYACKFASDEWLIKGGLDDEEYPHSDNFDTPLISTGMWFAEECAIPRRAIPFNFYFCAVAGNASVWFSKHINVVLIADTTH